MNITPQLLRTLEASHSSSNSGEDARQDLLFEHVSPSIIWDKNRKSVKVPSVLLRRNVSNMSWSPCFCLLGNQVLSWNPCFVQKEWSWAEVDEPRACYMEWSKLERQIQTLYINIGICNLLIISIEKNGTNETIYRVGIERRREWTCNTAGVGEGGTNWESSTELGLPWWLRCKEFACDAGDPALISGWGRSPGEEYSGILAWEIP